MDQGEQHPIETLRAERDAALAGLRATAEVLQVINANPGELAPVFDAMLDKAMTLCAADFGIMRRYDGHALETLASRGVPEALAVFMGSARQVPVTGHAPTRALHGRRPVHVLDVTLSAGFQAGAPGARAVADLGGARTMLHVPLVKDQGSLGLFTLYRQEVRAFTEQQIELVQGFAAQAVIAMETARLLTEQREALERQVATAEVLRVISRSPTDVQPVFDAIALTAVRLLRCGRVAIQRCDDTHYWSVARASQDGPLPIAFDSPIPIDPTANFPSRAIVEKRTLYLPDWSAIELPEHERAVRDRLKLDSALFLPMLRDGKCLGVMLFGATDTNAFDANDIALAESFRDQAVIAIENARLFNETREALERQTATAEVLQVINTNPGALQPVFEAMLERAVRLCGADLGYLQLVENGRFVIAADHGDGAVGVGMGFDPEPGSAFRAMLDGARVVHIPDVADTDAYRQRVPARVATVEIARARTGLWVALRRDDAVLGSFLLYRRHVEAFTDRQIALLESFADQAVIAIENARLLEALRERTAELDVQVAHQAATIDVLKVMSSTASDTQPVFDIILKRAIELCDAHFGAVCELREGHLHLLAISGFAEADNDVIRRLYPRPLSPDWIMDHAILERRVVKVADMLAARPDLPRLLGGGVYRAQISVPLLRDGDAMGCIMLSHREADAFTETQVALLRTFAEQAVIAMGSVETFRALQQRTEELARSLDDLRAAQDRLVQTEKLASLGQLTAGIAHEIKNPLNFVNNFAELSAELLAELRDEPEGAGRAELIETLEANLGKIVQHGRRADGIVRNMLLHSRAGESECRVVGLNALAEEALNLAYHGARAAEQAFNITLETALDPAVGEVELYPQEITRVLLNLIGNGFYAARQRALAEGGEPCLVLATRDLGDAVEIRVRDNGTGIDAATLGRIFQPFFTTKPAGEGTGLGLSLSHDIVVKQHGGRLDVASEPGAFAEFTVTLPRRLRAASAGSEAMP